MVSGGVVTDVERHADAREPSEVIDLWKLACLLGPLVFLIGVVWHFNLESKAFLRLLGLAAGGFVIQYFLPLRHRLRFFLVLSVSALAYLLGVRQAVWIVGLGLGLIGLCHLPISLRLRVLLLVGAGVALASLRAGWVPNYVPPAVWPILGSMFMFRLVVYLYDLAHEPGLASPSRSLAYFFLLPNVCFPLFPVVDFKTYCKQYFNADRHDIYMVGVQWIYRGIVQLILYRLVYLTLVSDPASVQTVASLGQYLLWPYLLYLRVSSQFHIVVGILHLFGFNLPETHKSYFLASSFTDFWRRINIYWKDFMMKLFYYPAYFAWRRRGETTALVLATLLVFVVTWALHSYQTFWIQGFFLLAWHDALFWMLLAVFVVVNALHEWRRGRQRRLTERALTWPQTWRLVLKTVAMFATMCVLWSMWSTESLAEWLSLWSAALVPPAPSEMWVVALLVAVPTAITVCVIANARSWMRGVRLGHQGEALLIMAAASVLVLGTTSRVYKRLGTAGETLSALRFGGLNRADAVELERGYYENLMGVDRFNGQLWDLYMNRPPDWQLGLTALGLSRPVDGFPNFELTPSAEARFKGAVLRTNRWGMHDKDYSQALTPGCHRMAVLGASHAMGSGVRREDTFEAVLEGRLNREPIGSDHCFQILNFAVYGYTPLFQLSVFNRKVAHFLPNSIVYVAHPDDADRVVRFLAQAVREGRRVPYPDLQAFLDRAGVNAQMPERVIHQKLAPLADEILSWLYHRLIEECRLRGIVAGYVFLPMIPESKFSTEGVRQVSLAAAAGFRVIDLSRVYEGTDRQSLWIADWDAHPNAKAHKLIADTLYDQLRRDARGLLRATN